MGLERVGVLVYTLSCSLLCRTSSGVRTHASWGPVFLGKLLEHLPLILTDCKLCVRKSVIQRISWHLRWKQDSRTSGRI